MKLKSLLLSAICALSLSAFAQTGTLLFYEDFNNGATAEANPDIADYKVDGKFYIASPTMVDGDWYHGPKDRWEYPNNSKGSVWRPVVAQAPEPNPAFYFQVNTSDFEYAYLSLASLYWGNYRVSYSFDNSEYTDFSRDDFYRFTSLPLFEGLRNWWYDQYAENIGGKEVVYIEFECISGNPLQIDDIQITGYNSENGYAQAITPLIKTAIEGIEPVVIGWYDLTMADFDDTRYCETKLQKLELALDTVQVIMAKGDEATLDDYYKAYLALQNNWGLADQQRDNTGGTVENDFFDAVAMANAVIAIVDDFEYAEFLPETLMLEFEALFTEADQIPALCEAGYLNRLTEGLTLLCATIEEEVARIQQEQDEIASESAAAEAFFVYPNPADAEIRIAGAAGGNIYIFNAAGQQVLSVTNYQGNAIPVSSLTAGIYKVAYGRQAASFIKK